MKRILLLLFFITITVSCQEQKEEEMIEQFIIDLFDDKIAPNVIVEKYLEIKPDEKNELSLLDRLKGAANLIKETRKGKGVDGVWLIPSYSIKQIHNPKVYPYKRYENLSSINLSGIETVKDNVYVLLNPEKDKILQYVLLNETNNKILSFSLLVKDKTRGFFFSL